MEYQSTRGGERGVSPSLAIVKGLAKDGGLFVPESIPKLPLSLRELSELSYQDLAYEIMKLYLTDFTEEELRFSVESAYDKKFDTAEIAPVVKKGGYYYLELFHGKTLAFKDMALSILPYLMKVSTKKNNIKEKIVILTATSGDTGKAAMEGFSGVEGTEIIVFYPEDGVSSFQERQMRAQKGKNTHVAAILGNFDDAQSGVKRIFADEAFQEKLLEKGYRLSSANSINIGRLVPQIVYYVYAYCKLLKMGELSSGETLTVSVPTGNFGNILAAYFAKEMGLPIGKLLCASNENKVLSDFFHTGIYDKNRPFHLTTSPSMDILISSNLERLLYEVHKKEEDIERYMTDLRERGRYQIPEEMQEDLSRVFYSGSVKDGEGSVSIFQTFKETGYVMDPHTAVAKLLADNYCYKKGKKEKILIVSTASPFKFAQTVLQALKEYVPSDTFSAIQALSTVSGKKIPETVKEVMEGEILHNTVCTVSDMERTVSHFLLL